LNSAMRRLRGAPLTYVVSATVAADGVRYYGCDWIT